MKVYHSMLTLLIVASGAGFPIMAQTMSPPPKSPPWSQPVENPATLFPAVLELSRHAARMTDGRLCGEGAEFLRALARESQFVLIGEEHGHSGTAKFTTALWRLLSEDLGFGYAAFEIDPWVAAALEYELRAGGIEAWTQFVAPRGGAWAAPFFTWTEEAELAAAIVESRPESRQPVIWGLEQVFLGSVQWQLRDIADGARNGRARELAARHAEEAAESRRWLGQNVEKLAELRTHLDGRLDACYAAMVDAMILSARIYRPFITGEGEIFLANHEREQMHRRNFLERYRAAEQADGQAPRVLFKFGAYHMYRGATPTHIQGLGGFITEFAVITGAGAALTVLVIADADGAAATFENEEVKSKEWFEKNWGFLTPYLEPDGVTVFDLRGWRMRPKRWAHLPEPVRLAINSFDILVVAPGGASTLLPGLPASE